MPLSPDGFGQELIKKPSLDLHAVEERGPRPAQARGEMRRRPVKEEEEGEEGVCQRMVQSREGGQGRKRGVRGGLIALGPGQEGCK